MKKRVSFASVAISASMTATFLIMLLLSGARAQDRPGLSERITVQELKAESGRADLIRMQAMVDHNALLISGLSDQIATVKGIGIGFGGILGLLQIIQIMAGKKKGE